MIFLITPHIFELEVLQRVRFWIKDFTTLQIVMKNVFSKKHDFEDKKHFWKARFWRKSYV